MPAAAFSLIYGLAISVALAASVTGSASEPSTIAGPNACAECHKDEAEAWKHSHHFKTFREMPRRKEGQEIAKKMNLRRIKSESLCLDCHFTVQQVKKRKPKPIAGISCESCHSNGEDWIKIHSEFSGKTEETETKAEEAERWKLADSKGMIRPGALYKLAKNCYSCHVVPQEKLVNVGGHPAGSPFELVSWSQGEVRHNSWYSKGKNEAASAARKRMLYLVGQAVELETALRAVSKASVRKTYAFEMAERADKARKALEAASKAVPQVAELTNIIQYSYSAGLKLNNEAALTKAADGIAAQILSMTATYDGSQLAAVDPLVPGADDYKGKAWEN